MTPEARGRSEETGHAGGLACWRLFREDDNGARFHVADFPAREDAERRAAELAIGGHKQAYFVEPEAGNRS